MVSGIPGRTSPIGVLVNGSGSIVIAHDLLTSGRHTDIMFFMREVIS